jgi:hypothetical protein
MMTPSAYFNVMIDFAKFIDCQLWTPEVKAEAAEREDEFGPLTLAQWQEWAKIKGVVVFRC